MTRGTPGSCFCCWFYGVLIWAPLSFPRRFFHVANATRGHCAVAAGAVPPRRRLRRCCCLQQTPAWRRWRTKGCRGRWQKRRHSKAARPCCQDLLRVSCFQNTCAFQYSYFFGGWGPGEWSCFWYVLIVCCIQGGKTSHWPQLMLVLACAWGWFWIAPKWDLLLPRYTSWWSSLATGTLFLHPWLSLYMFKRTLLVRI